MTGELFIALHVEELPARFVDIAEQGLKEAAQTILKGIPYDNITTWASPRHIAISVSNVEEASPTEERLVTGPPERAAFRDGQPTKVALGFAKGKGVSVEDLEIVESKRGPVVGIRVKTGGERTISRIQRDLETRVAAISFPKTMRWGNGQYAWARPIQGLIVSYQNERVPCTIFGIESSTTASGHRLSPTHFQATNSQDWLEGMRKNYIEPDAERRRARIRIQLEEKTSALNAQVLDMDLLDEVCHLVEWPVTIVGQFPEDLLALPSKLLVEAMKLHQRVFPLYRDGTLLSSFLAVTNQPFAVDPSVASNIAEGNKRVLTARFYDAKFFYAEDRKKTLEQHGSKLHKMKWIRNAGTMADKSERIRTLAEKWAPHFGADPHKAARGAQLCKSDLCTQMVSEFPKLQGHVGKLLAGFDLEDTGIPQAIEEHYFPRFSGDKLASTPLGMTLAAADRWDTLQNCFALNLQPKGSGDPLGLRRAANGFLQTILAADIAFDLETLTADQKNGGALLQFMMARLRTVFQEMAPNDIVNSIMATNDSCPISLQSKLKAMLFLSKTEQYQSLRGIFKRVTGLSKNHSKVEYLQQLFENDAEVQLHHQLTEAKQKTDKAQDHAEALQALVAIKPALEHFFASVMVMDERADVRENRLSLLADITQSFNKIADFSLLSTE